MQAKIAIESEDITKLKDQIEIKQKEVNVRLKVV